MALWTSCGKHVDADGLRDVVMSDASRRKQAVWVRAGRGVVGRCVVKKADTQVVVGVRDFVVDSCEMICVEGFDIIVRSDDGSYVVSDVRLWRRASSFGAMRWHNR